MEDFTLHDSGGAVCIPLWGTPSAAFRQSSGSVFANNVTVPRAQAVGWRGTWGTRLRVGVGELRLAGPPLSAGNHSMVGLHRYAIWSHPTVLVLLVPCLLAQLGALPPAWQRRRTSNTDPVIEERQAKTYAALSAAEQGDLRELERAKKTAGRREAAVGKGGLVAR